MSDELRTMAEAVAAEESFATPHAKAVARAYLADRRPDDGEPAAWPWLACAGFKEQSEERSLLTVGPWTLEISGGTGGSTLWLNNAPVCDEPTRGDVRRLCAGLQVPFREPWVLSRPTAGEEPWR